MSFSTALILGVLVLLALSCAPDQADDTTPTALNPSHFVGLHDFSHFTVDANAVPNQTTLESPVINAPINWDELVVSWNTELPTDASLQVEAKGIYPDHTTKYYTLGRWSGDRTKHPRESVNGQQDNDGNVNTDTLVLKRPGAQVQLRLTLEATIAAPELKQSLKFIGLSFCDSKAEAIALEPNRAAWGKVIAVPERSQVSYKGGEVWCSPTSVSMDLAHWSEVLHRPELNKDVPEVAHSVYDQTWGGTGNWPFNTAFAGSFPGVRAYVTRLGDVSELEDWIAAGIPVILSVSYDLLKGKAESQDAGHLIVGVGFTAQGDIVVNDPWAQLEKGESVRKTFPRKNLVAGWGNSHNTVYLIYPETTKPPHDRFGHWDTP